MFYSSSPEIDAARHEEKKERMHSAMQERLELAARDLTEATLQAMREGPAEKVRGTRAITAGEALYEVHQLRDGGEAVDAAICYLAKSSDPEAQAHAAKIASLFARSHIGVSA